MSMLKHARYPGEAGGESLVRVVHPGDGVKTANMLPGVQSFIDQLEPCKDYTYVLVNAMGYSEYYGDNSNSDWYGYNPHLDFNGLLHAWDGIGQDNETDRMKGRDWPFGYPCFYNATVYAHHKNDNPQTLGFGDVIYSTINPIMKRVELMLRVFNEEAEKKGHTNILSRIAAGERCDVSMGAKVPFDFCLTAGSMIRTSTGYVPVECVNVGDLVWTHRKRYRRVTRTFHRVAKNEVVKIHATGLPRISSSEAHPHLVVRKEAIRTCLGSANNEQRRCRPVGDVCSFCGKRVEAKPEWINAGDIRCGDYLVGSSEVPGSVREPRARLAGYYLGDGWTIYQRRGKNKQGEKYLVAYGISAEHARPEHRDRIGEEMLRFSTTNEPRLYAEGNRKSSDKWYCYDRTTAEWLRQCIGEGSRGKRLNDAVLEWDEYSLLELLGGWIDAYGSYDENKGSVRIGTVSHELALGGLRVARALGMLPTLSYQRRTSSWFLILNRTDAARLSSHSVKATLDTNVRSVRTPLVSLAGLVLHPVRKIEAVDGDVDVYNFSVEDDESYEVEGVITHNCSICTDWAEVKKALSTFDATKHRHPGVAVLAYHRFIKKITGLAITRKDYCKHMLEMPGKILPDGRKVFVYNDWPRFFDISFVWIGADRTARVMWFLSGSTPKNQDNGMKAILDKLFAKTGTAKLASMNKEIPNGIAQAVKTDLLETPDMSLTFQAIVGNGDRSRIRKLFTALATLGILPTPHEFQSLVLPTMPGGDSIKKSMDAAGLVFDDSIGGVDDSFAVDPALFDEKLAGALTPLMSERSSFAPFLHTRMINATKVAHAARVPPQIVRHPLMDKIAAQYNGLKISLFDHAENLFPKVACYLNPSVYLAETSKHSGLGPLLLGIPPVIHLLSSHLEKKKQEGQPVGQIANFIAENPTFTSMATIGAALRAAIAVSEAGGIGPAAGAIVDSIRKVL